MTKNRLKIIILVVVITLAVVLAGGLIAHTVVTNKTTTDTNEVDSSAVFTVTPQNTASKLQLTSRIYSENSDISTYGNEKYRLTADTSYYTGSITWTMDWTGNEVYWASSEQTSNVSDCVKLTELDNRSVQVECLRPFGQQIEITAALTDKPSVKDKCVCNYKQVLQFDELEIGFNTFTKSGELGRSLVNFGIVRANVNLYGDGTLDYRCLCVSTSYTIESSKTNCAGVSFSFTPNMEVIEEFGLDKYSFMTYTVDFENSISGSIDGFFDTAWGLYAVSGTNYTINDLAIDLCCLTNENGFGIDSADFYTLTISGLPEANGSVSYGYKVDLYELMQEFGDMADISLNNNNITFGGD